MTARIVFVGTIGLMAAGLGAYVGWTRVMHQVEIERNMRWECVGSGTTSHPDGQTVRLSFVEKPGFVDTVSGVGLCDDLRRTGHSIVRVRLIAWGNRSRGLVGYREDSIEGERIQYVGGAGWLGRGWIE